MMKPFSADALMEQMRRENTHDEEQRLVIIGNGVDGNPYADDNRIWVRDIGSKGEGDYSVGGVAYRVLAGTGYKPEIDRHVWIQWQPGPRMWQAVMSDPDFMQATEKSMHLENWNDPHNQFRTTEGLMPLLSKPLPNGYANVQGWQFVTEDRRYGDYKGTSDVPTAISKHQNVLAHTPSTAAHHAYVLLAFNITKFFAGTQDPIDRFVSTSQSWLTPLNATDIQECLDQMATNSRPIKVYRVYTGQDALTGHADDRDLRGWLNVPPSIASLSPLATKGDLFTYSTVNTRLPVGANGTLLTPDSSVATGLKYVTAASVVNPVLLAPGPIGSTTPNTGAFTTFTGLITDTGTNTVVNVTTLGHHSSATPVAGYGAALLIQGKSSTTPAQNMARFKSTWVDPTHASREPKATISLFDVGVETDIADFTVTGIESPLDMTVTDSTKGFVVMDRTTLALIRIYVDNGVLSMETV